MAKNKANNPLDKQAGRLAEQDYQSVTATLEALLEAAVDAIIIIDDDGKIRMFNTAAERMFGYSAPAVVGKNVNILMPEPYSSQHDRYLQNYLETGEAKIIGIGREVKAQKNDGALFPIELSVGEIKGGDRKQFVGIIRDITERVRVETEIRDNQERLAHVTRVSTMGEMASGIAHEINQPLTAIATYAQACRRLLEQKKADPETLDSTLQKIGMQAQRAGEVIRRLRDFIKKRVSHRHVADIEDILQESVKIAQTDTRVLNYGLTLELNNKLPHIVVDSVQIQQVILNLIRNAIDAMEDNPGQPIKIYAEQSDNEFIEIIVSDQGQGLDEQTREKLFEPFFTTKSSGMGLGLSISQSIINSHGGRLWHTVNRHGGSDFHFTLPLRASPNLRKGNAS